MAPRKQPWFRFYVEAMTDPKLRRLTPAQKWLWVVVLGAAKQSHIEGLLMLTEREAMTVEDVADLAGMKGKEVRAGIDALLGLGLLELDQNLGAWQVVSWEKRQYPSDDVTQRTRKHRSKNDRSPPDRNGEATTMERSMNGNGTHQIQKTDTETEGTPPTPPSKALAVVSNGSSAPPTEVDKPSPVQQVFDAWITSTGRTNKTHLDGKRRRRIENALKAYPLEDVLDAVRGWQFSPHHRGENDRATVYNDLELILRDAAHIEQFRDFARNERRAGPRRAPSVQMLAERVQARREAQG